MSGKTNRIAHPAGRRGEARLRFERREGGAVLTEQYSRAPLQIMKPLTDETGACVVYLLSPTGGIAQGDEYDVRIAVGPGARAVFTTQAATKVYRMEHDGAQLRARFDVQKGGFFEYLPDPTILFAGSEFRQDVEATLAPGARLVYHETIMPGRIARGEHLAFRRYESCVTVRDDDGLLLYDRADVQPADAALDELGVLDRFACWGSWWLLGACEMDADVWDAVRAVAEARLNQDDCIGGVTRLRRNGIAARMLAQRAEQIEAGFRALSEAVYERVLGMPVVRLRKY